MDEERAATSNERADPDEHADGPNQQSNDDWDAAGYEEAFGYVHEYGADVVDLLDPQPGESILDLGCGTGHLTAEIAARVRDGETDSEAGFAIGVDAAPSMVAEARATYPDLPFAVADATRLPTDEAFDAVFSNAALHWIDDQAAVAERVRQALVPGGRFVAELGSQGNVAQIRRALAAELAARGHDAPDPFYFPSVGELAALLERHGFEVRHATLFDRPTDLDGGPDGLRDWLAMFGEGLFGAVDGEDREGVVAAVEDRLRPDMYDPESETWTADYRRLRFVAVRPA